ncbi:hypothetical protein chiPu_0004415, partial [Chiloscyllium punctatum]|nr:hypothetical protein [Chiloscyllium punctatum]
MRGLWFPVGTVKLRDRAADSVQQRIRSQEQVR